MRDIEHTRRDLLLEHGDASEDSVGTEIAIKYVAPTLLGMPVEITVTVSAVEGRKVSFDVSAKDEALDLVVRASGWPDRRGRLSARGGAAARPRPTWERCRHSWGPEAPTT